MVCWTTVLDSNLVSLEEGKKEVKKTALDEKKLKTHKNQMQWINLN